MKILLIDNDLKYLNFLKHELKIFSDQIITFTDPGKALEMIKREYYELVIIDLHISKINGIQLYKKIKEINNNINVIMLTFPFDIKAKFFALKNGVSAFYCKSEYQMICREVEILKINHTLQNKRENIL